MVPTLGGALSTSTSGTFRRGSRPVFPGSGPSPPGVAPLAAGVGRASFPRDSLHGGCGPTSPLGLLPPPAPLGGYLDGAAHPGVLCKEWFMEQQGSPCNCPIL